MTDIVERLRSSCWPITDDAADEIERLREDVRAIELAVDGLHDITPRKREAEVLARIKARCRSALKESTT